MANPGPFNPMGSNLMSGPSAQPNMTTGTPVGAQPMPRPAVVRRGTSKAVPVVVSAGLAVGVFCGLLFGFGTGKEDQASASTNNRKGDDSKDKPASTKPETRTDAKPADSQGSATAASGSNAGGSGSDAKGAVIAAAGSDLSGGSGLPGPGITTSASHVATLKLDVKPNPGPHAKYTIDGQRIDPTKPFELELGKAKSKAVTIAISSPGFRTYEQKIDVEADMTVSVELARGPVVTTGTATVGGIHATSGNSPRRAAASLISTEKRS
jgi:hypothetical protein